MALLRSQRLRSCSEENPSMISSLGDDLLAEILVRLPNYRFAFWCKPVCKRWRSLISSPCFSSRFISYHQRMDKLPAMLFHTDAAIDPQSVFMRFLPSMPDRVRACFKVLDCFKDLLLCGFMDLNANYRKSTEDPVKIMMYSQLGRTYLVCNPFTKQWMALPLAPEKPVGYEAPVTKLVCEPFSSNSSSDSNDGNQGFAFSSECRFRVVCIYQHQACIKLDVFCSESGRWTKEALVCPGYRKLRHKNVCSCNAELFWLYGTVHGEEGTLVRDQDAAELNPMLAVLNPFRLDIPATSIDASEFAESPQWDISVSQGALHVVELEEVNMPARLRVWKLEKDRLSWRKQCESSLVNMSWGNYKLLEHCRILNLHPERPHVVFFRYFLDDILCCDLSRVKLEFFTELRQLATRWAFFKPRVSCWPTPIPRYEELRGTYDGSCSWFRAANSNPLDTDLEQQALNALATVDVLLAATETVRNDLLHKIVLLPGRGRKRREYVEGLPVLNNELIELDSQKDVMLSQFLSKLSRAV